MAARSVPAPSPDTSPRDCDTCHGAGGSTQTTSRGRKTVQTWQRCADCKGSGVQGGGI